MNRIKSIRKGKGLTQTELAKILNVTQACVAMWESGSVMPSSSRLPDIAKALSCEISDLYEKEAKS